MIAQPYNLYIERHEPSRNIARYYVLSIEETLFGQVCLIRRWGRIGSAGRTIRRSCDDEAEAVGLFLHHLRIRVQHG